jgi:hypothetical protein
MVHNFNQFLQDLNEEKSESKSKPNLTFRDFDGLILEKDLQIEHVYRCVDKEMSIAIEHCLKKGIPKEFIKYGIGILGRESDYFQPDTESNQFLSMQSITSLKKFLP